MDQNNPYQATLASAQMAVEPPRKSSSFPFLLVTRWVVSVLLVIYGLLRVNHVIQGWSWYADRAILEPFSNPYLLLIMAVCPLLTGVLLFLLSRWAIAALIAHCALFGWYVFGFGFGPSISGAMIITWSAQVFLMGFLLLLAIRGRLK